MALLHPPPDSSHPMYMLMFELLTSSICAIEFCACEYRQLQMPPVQASFVIQNATEKAVREVIEH